MMHLNADKVHSISEEYCSAIIPSIKGAFKDVKPLVTKTLSSSPTTWKPVWDTLLDPDNNLHDTFLEHLLCRPLEELSSSYEWVDDYLNMGKMIFGYDKEAESWKADPHPDEKRLQYFQRYHGEHLLTRYPLAAPASSNSTIEEIAASDELTEQFMCTYIDLFGRWNSVLGSFLKYGFIKSALKIKIKKSFDLQVCPYCNRQYITFYSISSKEYATADLDHFYSQKRFPLFSLSLYNLIPSCLVCNRLVKSAKFQELWSPYAERFDREVQFQVSDPEHVSALTGGSDAFTLTLANLAAPDSDEFRLVDNTIEFFRLKEIYQSHKQYVRELLYKKNAYSKGYLRKLQDIFDAAGIGTADANLILYGHELDEEKTDERILGKLAYDIIKG